MATSIKVPKSLKPFFWDVDLDKLEPTEHREFIIERILDKGDHLSLAWLFHTYSQNQIREVVKSSRRLSLKTARCWQNYYELKEEEMRCFGTFSTSIDKHYWKH